MGSCGVQVVGAYRNKKFRYSQLMTFGVLSSDFTVLLSHNSMTYVDLTVSMAGLVSEIHDVV